MASSGRHFNVYQPTPYLLYHGAFRAKHRFRTHGLTIPSHEHRAEYEIPDPFSITGTRGKLLRRTSRFGYEARVLAKGSEINADRAPALHRHFRKISLLINHDLISRAATASSHARYLHFVEVRRFPREVAVVRDFGNRVHSESVYRMDS